MGGTTVTALYVVGFMLDESREHVVLIEKNRPAWQAGNEQVFVMPVSMVQSIPVIPNLRWLVPLACYTADTYEPFTVQATVAEVL